MQKRSPLKNSNRRKAYLWGMAAEYLCSAFLIIKGYSIVKIRYRNHLGEIDIIATRSNTIIFAEVKARTDKEAALYSVTPGKQKIISRAASGFIAANAKYSTHGLRFDVMVVTSFAKIHHMKDAWRH